MHTFQVGDQIYIQQTAGYQEEAYNGIHTVTYVPNPYAVLIDISFTGTPTNPGTAVYSDRRKTVFFGNTELLPDPSFSGSGTWSSYGPDASGNAITLNGSGQLNWSQYSASTFVTKYTEPSGVTFTPGVTYTIEYEVFDTFPVLGAQYSYVDIGGTTGTTNFGVGVFTENITCGAGNTLKLYGGSPGTGLQGITFENISVKESTSFFNYSAWNGAIQHQRLINYTDDTYTMSAQSPGRFLTDVPNGYRLRPDNKMWINFHAETKNDAYGAILNTRYGQYVLLNLVTGYTPTVYVLPCGPKNVTEVEGTTGSTGFYNWSNDLGTWPVFKNTCWEFDMVTSGPGIPATTILTNTSGEQSPWYNNFNDEAVDFYLNGVLTQAYIGATTGPNEVLLNFDYTAFTSTSGYIYQNTEEYSIYLIDITGGTSSETLNFNVERDVTRYSNIEIYFIDRLGSLICKNFELQNAQSIKVDRTEYQTLAGGLMNGKWNFLSTDRGRHVNNTTVVKQVELNAAFITEAESSYLQELISSPEVYIMEYGQLWPVVVKTNNYDVLTKLNKKNIPFKMTVEYANNDMVQNF